MRTFDRGQDVDRNVFPHLRRMQECVDEMGVRVNAMFDCIPFHALRWWRLRREWKGFQREWKREKKLHLAQMDAERAEFKKKLDKLRLS